MTAELTIHFIKGLRLLRVQLRQTICIRQSMNGCVHPRGYGVEAGSCTFIILKIKQSMSVVQSVHFGVKISSKDVPFFIFSLVTQRGFVHFSC